MDDRVIFHADCNSFFASVELLAHPELRDKPVAVSGSEDNRHGIILAKNEAAKRFRVQTAETVHSARRKCPELILLPPHHGKYRKFHTILNKIYGDFTDLVEPFGIDESWLDMTGSWRLFGPTPLAVADLLRRRVREETGLTVSVGISFNKVFAKLGSDMKKPDATTEIRRADMERLVWPMPVQSLLYVGQRVAESLAGLGIATIGQLAAADEDLLVTVLGKMGRQLSAYARGEENEPVARQGEGEPPKSVGNGMTFRRDLLGLADVRTGIAALADEVAGRLRRYNLYAGGVQVQIKNPQLKSISRQTTLPFATHLHSDISRAALELVRANWDLGKPIRMLTVTATHLTDTPFATQTSLFGPEQGIDPRRESLEKSIDKIRGKFGKNAVLPGGALHNSIGLAAMARVEEEEKDE